jgi:hypothetical protein
MGFNSEFKELNSFSCHSRFLFLFQIYLPSNCASWFLVFTSFSFISYYLYSFSSCLSSCINKLVLHCPTFFVIAEYVVGNYFTKYTRFEIIFLRHPLTTQTNDSLRFALVAWNTFNCCTNKVRNCEKLFLSGSIIWVCFLTEWILSEL